MSMFRHKTIAHFRVADFEFKNHVLKIAEKDGKSVEERTAEFRRHCEGLRRVDQGNIVEVNEAALAALEKPMNRVIKGADTSAANKTPSTSGAIRPVGLTDEELAAQKKSRDDLDSASAMLAKEKVALDEERAKFAAEREEFEKAKAAADSKNQPDPTVNPAPEPAPIPSIKPAGGLVLDNDPVPNKSKK